jgi:hypothetical protein
MTTLRIEHEIHDYDQWRAAFDGFSSVRAGAGVLAHTIRLPLGEPHYLMVDLEFATPEAARSFAEFLEQNVWSSPTSAPALAGVPRTRILDVMQKWTSG